MKALFLLLLALASTYASADCPSGQPQSIRLASGHLAMVAQGRAEPCSIGSYALRIYKATNPDFPYDDFVTGLIRQRDGSVESLEVHDLDDDGTQEIVVVIRNAGSGAYLSADALRYKGQQLELCATVQGLEKHADPVQALRLACKNAPWEESSSN